MSKLNEINYAAYLVNFFIAPNRGMLGTTIISDSVPDECSGEKK